MAMASHQEQRRFRKDDTVEVRSEEEGLIGSWHSGVVIETELLDSQIRYMIQYDHILTDDESGHCVENLLVNENEVCKLRGRIRPLPPPLKIGNFDVCYGMCVDAYYNDAWWEGVVLDHDEGSDTRSVFFPDLGDDMESEIADIRISQDWNSTTGAWKKRGTWLFLEILEEFENEGYINLLPIQVWFYLKQKENFQKLGEWFSGDKELWKILVLETLTDKSKLLSIYGKLKTSKCRRHTWLPAGQDMVPGPEFCPDAVVKYLQRNKKLEASLFVDIKKHLLHLGWEIEYSKEESFRRRYTSPEGKLYHSLRQICLSLNELHTENISSASHEENGSLFSCHDPPPLPLSKELPENCVTAVSCDSDFVYVEPEYCPEAAADWYRYGKTQSSSNEKGKSKTEMTLKARMHLSALGWHFRWAILHWGKREMRYISPAGKVYSSLRTACRDAIGSCANDACTPQEESIVSRVNVNADFQKNPPLKIRFKLSIPLQKSKVRGPKKINRKKKLSSLLSSSLHKRADFSDAQYAFSNLRKIRKTRGLIKLQNDRMVTRNKKSVLRTSRRVKQIAAPNLSIKKPLTVLSWLIENNIVLPRAKVHFCCKNGSRSTAGGRITRDGIKCNCCCRVYGLSGFTFHISGEHHSPAATIVLKDGRSLLECQNEIVQKEMRNFVEEPPGSLKDNLKGENDNICSVCQFGGELLLCDQCPSSFHKSCLDLADVPDGDWFCPSCCCKICGHNKLERDPECSTKEDDLLNCTQCEQKYHFRCIRNRGKRRLTRIPRGNWFCNKKCKEIFSGLSQLIGKPIPVGSNNLTWTLLKPNQSEGRKPNTLSDRAWIDNCSKLSIAVDIMHECFENVEEPYTKRDLLKDVIFNRKSELKRLNFGGFYTVILQKDDEFVSVATIRVHGETVAELPLVGTRFQYRRLGLCRVLMNILEKKLMELGVQRLILPAVPSVLNTWTGSFGFSKLTVSERLQFADYTFLDFQGTVMCCKQLTKIPSAESWPSRDDQTRLDNIATASCDNMDIEGLSSTSDVFQSVPIQAGTLEQSQAEYVVVVTPFLNPVTERVASTNSSSRAEERIDPIIMLNSQPEPYAGEISMDYSVDETTKNNNNGNDLKMETGHRFGGLKVYTRRSAKCTVNGELKYYKRRRLRL